MTSPAPVAADVDPAADPVEDLPAPEADLRAYSDRLAALDLWEDTARIRLALLTDDTDAQDRLNTAWAAFRAHDIDAARDALDPLSDDLGPVVAALRTAIDAVDGDHGAFHRLMAEAADPDAADLLLRMALAAALAHDDAKAASMAAKRLLAHAPQDAGAWVVIAAEKAAVGDWAAALNAVEKARVDRFDAQPDPAEDTLLLLEGRGHADAAAALAAHGAVTETSTRAGWVGWRGLLGLRAPKTFSLGDGPYAVIAFVAAAASAYALIGGYPAATVLHVLLAFAAGAWLRRLPVAGYDPKASALIRAAYGRRSRLIPSVPARARDHLDPFTSPAPARLDPAVCACWETDWFSGASAEAYLAEHLRTDWFDEDLAVGVSVCRETGQRWVLVPGFAVRAPAPDAESAPSAASGKADEAVKVGQYL